MGPEIEGNVTLALGLTLAAGLATGLGSLVVFFSRRPHMALLSFGLGMSSGVMVYISLVELLPAASDLLGRSLGETAGGWLASGCFFGGMLVSALIDKLVPEPENPHEAVSLEAMQSARQNASVIGSSSAAADKAASLARLGPLTALVIGVHNFPEGMATFASSLADPSLGLSIAIAVAIHNVPEGVAVAVPTFFATRSRKKAVFYSFASGLAEPIGALFGYLVLMSFLDELVPTAREYGKGHTAIAGVMVGMALMAVSLLLF
jgi:ZIP family zinc transporter